jgi:hypothetical protein
MYNGSTRAKSTHPLKYLHQMIYVDTDSKMESAAHKIDTNV